MRVDRFVKLMLVLVALLLALNCTRDFTFRSENSAEAAAVPSFLEVGKTYRAIGYTYQPVFKVVEIHQASGWAKVQFTQSPENNGAIVWFNPHAWNYIVPVG
jgi:hypothetical protein